ncbi:hypothetical protein [Streptomyces sp. 061-3]|uniref:hypothetical protein n=1 Tax=Streptomyces sp. 061-3 TaxID=2789268 RepID=UPI00397E9D64
MGVYELDIYAKTLYGAPLFVAFDTDVVVEQRGYGALEVTWDTPVQAGASQILAGVKSWTKLRLVRNSYGVPDTEDDGWVVMETPAGTDTGTFLDDTVVPGQVYYYGVFVSTAPDAWDSTVTYYPGDLVTYNTGVYISILAGPSGAPDLNPTYWSLSGISEQWLRCGAGGVGMAVRDFGNSLLLYDSVPRPYKVAAVESTASSIPVNEQLARFCRLFGYFFDVMKCENDQLLRMNDVLRCTDRQISLLAQQMGIADRLPTLPELRRTYVRDAALIQRDRGSTSSTAALVRAITGWDADVSIGYNELHDLDEAAFASPTFPVWKRDTVYSTTAGSQLYSDIVQYNGELYAATGTPRRESAYLSYTGSNPVRTGTGTIVRDPDRVADPFPGYVRLNGAAVGDTLTFTFSAASGGAGFYNVCLVAVADPAGGIVTAKVNGSAAIMAPLDLYSPSRQLIPIQLLGEFNLTATNNTLALTVTGKNALSTGYAVTASYWMLQGGGLNLNVPPTGNANSAVYWQALTPNTLQDTLTEQNLLTGGYGSWNLSTGGVNNPDIVPGVSADWWVSPQGARSGTSSPGTGNSLNYTAKSTAGTREVFLSGPIKASNWDSTNTYFPGQAVIWNPLGWSKAPVYTARAQSVSRQPDLNPDKWSFTPYTANSSPEPSRIITDSIYTPKVVSWSSTKAYEQGDRIAWRGHLYEAALPSRGIFPTGYNTDNLWWRWCGLNAQRYTFTVYHNRTATATGADVRLFVNYYTSNGVFGGNITISSDAQLLYDRFELQNLAYPQSTGSVPTGYVKPAAAQMGVPIPWNVSYGTWENARGVVRPTGWNSASATERKAGRVLWFNRNWVYDPPAIQQGESAYVTFMSAPDNSAGTMEHGIVCRYSPTAYWLASRDRLTYTTVTLSGSTVTAVAVTEMATWAPVQSGERFLVRNRAADILVQARAPGGTWRTLTTVNDTRNNTALGWGLLERVRS